MAIDSAQTFTSDQDSKRAAAAKRLKSAQRAMIVSVVFTVLLLVVMVSAFVNGHYSDSANHGQTSILGVFAAVVLLRVAYRGWRLYTTWRNLKEAQDTHRSLQ